MVQKFPTAYFTMKNKKEEYFWEIPSFLESLRWYDLYRLNFGLVWKPRLWPKDEVLKGFHRVSWSFPGVVSRASFAFFFQNESEFRRQLRTVRSQQMGFLSAASMESGSYQRGYEHIVRYTYSNNCIDSVEERQKGFYSRISLALPFLSFP